MKLSASRRTLLLMVLVILSLSLNVFQWCLSAQKTNALKNGFGTSVSNGRDHLIPAIANLELAIKGEQRGMSFRESASQIFAAYRIMNPIMFLDYNHSIEWGQITNALFTAYETVSKIETASQKIEDLTPEQKDTLQQIRVFLTEVRASLDSETSPSIRITIGADPDVYIDSGAIERAARAATEFQTYIDKNQQ